MVAWEAPTMPNGILGPYNVCTLSWPLWFGANNNSHGSHNITYQLPQYQYQLTIYRLSQYQLSQYSVHPPYRCPTLVPRVTIVLSVTQEASQWVSRRSCWLASFQTLTTVLLSRQPTQLGSATAVMLCWEQHWLDVSFHLPLFPPSTSPALPRYTMNPSISSIHHHTCTHLTFSSHFVFPPVFSSHWWLFFLPSSHSSPLQHLHHLLPLLFPQLHWQLGENPEPSHSQLHVLPTWVDKSG